MNITSGIIIKPQKVVIYGPEGIGKSTFASQFPDPLFDDTEGSTFKLNVRRTPKSSSWTMLLDHAREVRDNPSICRTFIVDTADWAEQLGKIHVCSKANKNGIEDFGYGKGYTYLAEEFGKLLNLLQEVVDSGVNVVLNAHATMRKFEQPDEMGSYDRWEMKLEKKVFPLVKEWADMVLFVNYETYVVKTDDKKNKAQGGKRVMYTAHHPCWDAKNRDGLDPKLPFDYKEIAHCIPGKVVEQQKPVPEIVFLGAESPKTPEVKNVEPPKEKCTPEHAIENYSSSCASICTEWVTCKQLKESQQKQAQTQPKQETPKQEKLKQELSGVPKPLADLMATNEVTIEEIQQAVSGKGYYPKNTPIEKYDPNFVAGVLIGAWAQVFQMVKDFRDDVPF